MRSVRYASEAALRGCFSVTSPGTLPETGDRRDGRQDGGVERLLQIRTAADAFIGPIADECRDDTEEQSEEQSHRQVDRVFGAGRREGDLRFDDDLSRIDRHRQRHDLAREDRDLAVHGVALLLGVQCLDACRNRRHDLPVELVPLIQQAVDLLLDALTRQCGGLDRAVAPVGEVRVRERVRTGSRVFRVPVGEEDVEDQRVLQRLHVHLLEKFRDGQGRLQGLLRDLRDRSRLREAGLGIEAHQLVGPVLRRRGGRLDQDLGASRVLGRPGEGIRSGEPHEDDQDREHEPDPSPEHRPVLSKVDGVVWRRNGRLHPCLHLC